MKNDTAVFAFFLLTFCLAIYWPGLGHSFSPILYGTPSTFLDLGVLIHVTGGCGMDIVVHISPKVCDSWREA